MANDFESITEKLNNSKDALFLTRGASMRPLFREHRDVITVSKVFGELKRGDVVLYPCKNSPDLILHRILKVKGDDLIIRGDNNFFLERRKKTEMVGVMTSFFRDGKYCDCKKSIKYKFYTCYILNTYPIRFLWRIKTRPFLIKTAKFVFKLLGIKRHKK